MSRSLRLIAIFLIVLALGAAGAWGLLAWRADLWTQGLIAEIEAAGAVTLVPAEPFRVAWLPRPSLRGGMLEARNASGDVLARADRIAVDTDWPSLLSGRAQPARVALDGLQVAGWTQPGIDVEVAFGAATTQTQGLRVRATRTAEGVVFDRFDLSTSDITASGSGSLTLAERRLVLSFDRLTVRGADFAETALAGVYERDGVTVERVRLRDPMGTAWGAFGHVAWNSGGASFLGGFELDGEAGEFGGLGRLEGSFTAGGVWRFAATDATLNVGDTRIAGAVRADGAARTVSADLRADRLDFDRSRAAAILATPAALAAAADATLELRARVGTLAWAGQTADGVIVDVAGKRDGYELREFAVRDYAGAPLFGKGRFRILERAVAFDALELRRRDLTLTGTAELAVARIAADLTSTPLDLDALLKPPPAPPAGALTRSQIAAQRAAAAAPVGWSKQPAFPAIAAPPIEVALTLKTPQVKWGGRTFDDVALTAVSSGDTIDVRNLSAALYKGKLAAHGRIAAQSPPEIQAVVQLTDGRLEDALAAQFGLRSLSGRVDAAANLSARGASAAELIASLSGDARITAHEGVIQGVDLGAMSQRIATLTRPTDVLDIARRGLGGRTPFTSLDGAAKIERGVARIDGARLVAPSGEIRTSGVVDLPAWTLNLANEVKIGGAANPPPLTIRLRGPVAAPNAQFDIEALQKFLTQRR